MWIYVDYRESKVLECITELTKGIADPTTIVVRENLPIGDFIITNAELTKLGDQLGVADQSDVLFVIERKSFNDMYSSVCDNKYHEQKKRLADTFPAHKIVYILERSAFSRDTRKRKIVNGCQLSIQFKSNFHSLYSMSESNTAELLLGLCKKITDGDINCCQIPVTVEVPVSMPKRSDYAQDTWVAQLCCIQGVSLKTAQRIKTVYPNMLSLVQGLTTDPVKCAETLARPDTGRAVSAIVVQRILGSIA